MKNQAGFTLVEMLLVVVILSTLAAMIIPRFVGRSDEARAAAAQADINAHLASALDLFELDNGVFPARLEDLATDPGNVQKWRGPYLKKKKTLNDPWGQPYQYRCPGEKNEDYDLWSFGPDRREGTSDDIANWEIEDPQR